MAVQDFSISFFGQAKSVLKGYKDEKCYCVYIEFLINYLAPSTYVQVNMAIYMLFN